MPSDKKPVADEAQVAAPAEEAGAQPAAEAPAADAAAPVAEDPAAGAPDIPKGVAVLKHPSDDKASASYRGHNYEADERGFLIVPLDAVEDLKAHGFVMVKEG